MTRNHRWHLIEVALAASLLIFAVVTILFVIPQQVLPPKTVFGATPNSASPAMVPYALCTLILIFAAIYLGRSLVRLKAARLATAVEESGAGETRSIGFRVPAIIVFAVAYTLSFDTVPFLYSTSLYLIACYFALEDYPLRLRWKGALALVIGAVGFSVLIKEVFEHGFRIYLGG